ncbi:hypothetical protein JRQ81_011599 [Phrynocephalus forsythii]|uniref:G-protein coupled receptors family 1 profile domain-containing protein n=1 Tax=Phrynocephalus forsythii TaxID=171643 RepID=A0A9Q1AQN6_9SAUR|nr:hypothetical protein JRQ81_011599 [Phrynocephalus forsythii]
MVFYQTEDGGAVQMGREDNVNKIPVALFGKKKKIPSHQDLGFLKSWKQTANFRIVPDAVEQKLKKGADWERGDKRFLAIKMALNNTSEESLYDGDYEDYDDFDDTTELRGSMRVLSMVVYSLAFLLGVTGNSLVIFVTGFRMKRTVTTVWFINLAIADFVFTFFLPLSVAYMALGFHWPFGKVLCKLSSTVAFLNMFASVFLLMVISMDRCISVVCPVWSQNYRNPRLASLVALGVWAAALALSSPYLVFRDTRPSPTKDNTTYCYNNFALSDDFHSEEMTKLGEQRHQAMVLVRFVAGFLVPFTVILLCYGIIMTKLKGNRITRSSRPFKIMVAVILAFFICWFPYHVFSFLEMSVSVVTPWLQTVLIVGIPLASGLAYINSCLNPFLYVFVGQDFREKLQTSVLAAFENAFSETLKKGTDQSEKCLPMEMEITALPTNLQVAPLNFTSQEDYNENDKLYTLWKTMNIFSIIIYTIAFVLGVAGNGLVIFITGFRMKKTVNTIWFLNLAIADFTFTLFLPFSIAHVALEFHWPLGLFMCKLNSALAFVNLYASVYLLMVISIDRCISVRHPVWAQNHRTPRLASFVALGIWIVALVFSSPVIYFRDTAPSFDDPDAIDCYSNYGNSTEIRRLRHHAMIISRFIFAFVVPFSVIVVCYGAIVLRLKRNRLIHSTKPFKVITAVIVAFFVCWFPHYVFLFLEARDDAYELHLVLLIGVPLTSSLAFINSCLNPILYVFMGHDFKERVRRSLLSAFENAFAEDVSHSTASTKAKFSVELQPQNFGQV